MMPMTPSGTLTREMSQPIGPGPLGQDTADRVGQRGDVLKPAGDGLEPRRIEREAIDQRGADFRPLGVRDILGIGGEDLVRPGAHRGGGGLKRARPGFSRGERQRRRGIAGAPPDLRHRRGETGLGVGTGRRLRSGHWRHRRSVTTRSSR